MKRPFHLKAPKLPRLIENDVERQCLDLLRLRRYRPERLHVGKTRTLDGKRYITLHPTGTPDYIVAHPKLPAFYLEVKRPGETTTLEQDQKHFELRLQGFAVVTVDSLEALAAWIAERA